MTRRPHRFIAKLAATLALMLAAAPVAWAMPTEASTASGPAATIAKAPPVAHPTGHGLRGFIRTQSHGTAFHWGDAAIGAAGALGVALLAAGGIAASTDRRRRTDRAAQPTG